MFTRDPLLAWRSRECQEFYAESAPRAAPPGLRFDASSGLFLPPRRGRSTPIKRMRTREDTLDVAHCRLRAADAGALHVPIPKRVNAAFGVPIARGTVQRPGKAFVVEGSRRFIALAIEKSGLSSLGAWFANLAGEGVVVRDWHLCSGEALYFRRKLREVVSRLQQCAACANATGFEVAREIESLAAEGAAGPLSRRPRGAACGYASTFDAAAADGFNFALVRDPVARFVSALSNHGGLGGCWRPEGSRAYHQKGPCPDVLGQLVGTLRRLAHEPCCTGGRLGAKGRCELHLLPPHASIHWQTQSYFRAPTPPARRSAGTCSRGWRRWGPPTTRCSRRWSASSSATGVRGNSSLLHENSKQKKESPPRNTPTSCGGCVPQRGDADSARSTARTLPVSATRPAGVPARGVHAQAERRTGGRSERRSVMLSARISSSNYYRLLALRVVEYGSTLRKLRPIVPTPRPLKFDRDYFRQLTKVQERRR